jgi:hypothetical protein
MVAQPSSVYEQSAGGSSANDQFADRFPGGARRHAAADWMMVGILGKTFGKSTMEPYPDSI